MNSYQAQALRGDKREAETKQRTGVLDKMGTQTRRPARGQDGETP